MTETHPLIVRITTGRKPSSDITTSEATTFNTEFWEVLMRFFPETVDPKTVRVMWQSADPRSTCELGMLIEVIGAQPPYPGVRGSLEEVTRDLLSCGYQVVVDFPTHPVLDPVS